MPQPMSKLESANQLRALLKSISEEQGIGYLGDSPDHPIYKRGYTMTSTGSGRRNTPASPSETAGQPSTSKTQPSQESPETPQPGSTPSAQ